MGLIKCPDCGRAVSTKAAACPGCGRPLGGNKARGHGGAAGRDQHQAKVKQGCRTGLGCFLVVAGVCLVAMVIMLADSRAVPDPAPAPPSASASESGSPEPGGQYTVKPNYIGCSTKAELDRAIELAPDLAAFSRYLSGGSSCVPLTAGERVYFDDYAGLSGIIKIHRVGETSTLYALAEAIR